MAPLRNTGCGLDTILLLPHHPFFQLTTPQPDVVAIKVTGLLNAIYHGPVLA